MFYCDTSFMFPTNLFIYLFISNFNSDNSLFNSIKHHYHHDDDFYFVKYYIVQYSIVYKMKLTKNKKQKLQQLFNRRRKNSIDSYSNTCIVHTLYLKFYFMIVQKLCRQLEIQ